MTRWSKQDRHLQTSATHVLHLGDLVDDLAESVIDEVDEHEVDHGPRARGRRAAAESDKAAFTDRRITKTICAILVLRQSRFARPQRVFALAELLAGGGDLGAWL
jgi:hypothetical protein